LEEELVPELEVGLSVPAAIGLREIDAEPAHVRADLVADVDAVGQLAAEDAHVARLVVHLDDVLAREG
jgi:hypothetical protein